TNLHNPSSSLADPAALRRVGEIAATNDARVLVDEAYLDALPEPDSAIHLGQQFVVTNSLTKIYGISGLRCGWILAEPALAQSIARLNDLFGVNPAHPADQLSVVAFRNLDAIRARSLSLLSTNRKLLNQFLATRSDLEVQPLEYGTVVFPR